MTLVQNQESGSKHKEDEPPDKLISEYTAENIPPYMPENLSTIPYSGLTYSQINKIISEKSNGNKTALEEFFMRMHSLANTDVNIRAKRDNPSPEKEERYTARGQLLPYFFYHHSDKKLPSGLLVLIEDQETTRVDGVYFDRITGVSPHRL